MTAEYLSKFLRTDANSRDMNIDGATTPTTFYRGPGANRVWTVTRMLVYIADTAFTPSQYGDVPALANGLTVKVTEDVGAGRVDAIDFLDGETITSNGSWGAFCYDVSNFGVGQAGSDALGVRWTFEKAGAPIKLSGDRQQRLEVLIQDDLTGLSDHWVLLQGMLTE